MAPVTEVNEIREVKQIELFPGEGEPLARAVNELGKILTPGLLHRLGLIDDPGEGDGDFKYATLFPRLITHGKRGTSQEYVPLDLKNPFLFQEGGRPFTFITPLTLEEGIGELIDIVDGKPHKLALANMVPFLHEPDNPIVIVAQRNEEDPMRTFSFTRNNRVERFTHVAQAHNVPGILEVHVATDHNTRASMQVSNLNWLGGKTFKEADIDQMFDPPWSVTFALAVNGHLFPVQIGLKREPKLHVGDGLLTMLTHLRAFAEWSMERAWRGEIGILEALGQSRDSLVDLYAHDASARLTVAKAEQSLAITMLGLIRVSGFGDWDSAMNRLTRSQHAIDQTSLLLRKQREILRGSLNFEAIPLQNLLFSMQKELAEITNSTTDVKINIHVSVNGIDNNTRVLGLNQFVRGLLANGLINSILIAKTQNADEFNFVVHVEKIIEEDLVHQRKPAVRITISDDLGGADDDKLSSLNSLSVSQVESGTGGSGTALAIFRDVFNNMSRVSGIQQPVVFANTETAGGRGFTITLTLRETSGQ